MGAAAVCDYLAIKPRDVYRLIYDGRLPVLKVRGMIRLRRVDAERFARARARGAA